MWGHAGPEGPQAALGWVGFVWGLFVPTGTACSAAPMPTLAEAVKASPKPAASPVTA